MFVTCDGQTKIVDFGIARAARRMVETQAGVLKGKVSYMAPEQAFSPSRDIDGRADEFSVGVMLWEAIAGKRLWQGLGDPGILVDGAALPSNPFEGKFLRDGAVHRLQFEAVGFFPQSRLAVFDKDLSLDIVLQLKPKTAVDGPPSLDVSTSATPDPYGLGPR